MTQTLSVQVWEAFASEASAHPQKVIFYVPVLKGGYFTGDHSSWTLDEIHQRVLSTSVRLSQSLIPGTRVLFWVKPSVEWVILTFAMLRVGVVPIFLDPGLGWKACVRALEEAEPEGCLGEKSVRLVSSFLPKRIRQKWRWKNFDPQVLTASGLLPSEMGPAPLHTDLAAIVFTSGGTGVPKGVCYTQGMFAEQRVALQKLLQWGPQDLDLACFPLFSLLTIAMGVGSVLGALNPRHPARVKPKNLIRQLHSLPITTAGGSPAIWERVGACAQSSKETFPSLKSVMMFGAPVSLALHRMWEPLLPNGTTHAPYGATECLPVSDITGRELLHSPPRVPVSAGVTFRGVCLGKPLWPVLLEPLPGDSLLEDFPRGELLVQSPCASPRYLKEEHTEVGKKYVSEDLFRHRMGDVVCQDAEGRLWFQGRKAHMIRLENIWIAPIPVERVFNQHPQVRRSALVPGQEEGKLVLVVERRDGQTFWGRPWLRRRFFSELQQLGDGLLNASPISVERFFLISRMPVDIRHNIKIDRVALRESIKNVYNLNKI